ncbi:MAG: hypothetical protein ACSHXK_08180 [Oceanococcus sp.]
MFKIAMGASHNVDTAQAIGDVVAQALAGLGNAQAQAGILFNCGYTADSTILNAIEDTWPQLKLIGCAGEAAPGSTGQSLRLFLVDSPDLVFHLSRPLDSTDSAELAAEHALADFMHESANLALYLGLGDSNNRWYHSFEKAVGRLLPSHCNNLTPLLPPSEIPQTPHRYYMGRSVVEGACPILIARYRNQETSSWRFTRQRGIVRKRENESAYIYDTLIGDRRRMPAA